ncbi:MAG: beta-N-acetylhexosaminidase [Pseudomonadota bacterium]
MSAFGATILDPTDLYLQPEEKALFRAVNPYGFILFARNIDTPDQVRRLCGDLRDSVGREAPILVDQEGGRVQRLRGTQWRDWMAPLDFVQRAQSAAPRALYLMYRLIAAELSEVGIDTNCAPLVDIAGHGTHAFLRDRCYGDTAGTVARLGRAVADGLLHGGVLPVVKHIPGHGRATMDTHYDLPHVSASREDLMATDFAPFRTLNDLPLGMTAHLVFDAWDDAPATWSDTMVQVIREEIGFHGLLMSDDLAMEALEGGHVARAQRALAAGCDALLYCNQPLADRAAVAEAAGTMTPAAQTRAEKALAWRKTPEDIDIPALESELEALLGGAADG